MGMLLAFAPFIAFAVVDTLLGSIAGLACGFLVSLVLVVRDFMTSGRSPKVLEIGSVALFGGLALYTAFERPDWALAGVRLRVDLGLLIIVVVSMAIGRPFTLQYAREQVDRSVWDRPGFIRTNLIITAVWALAFLVMVIADLIFVYRPDVPPRIGIVITVLAIYGAFKFTRWYPDRVKSNASS